MRSQSGNEPSVSGSFEYSGPSALGIGVAVAEESRKRARRTRKVLYDLLWSIVVVEVSLVIVERGRKRLEVVE